MNKNILVLLLVALIGTTACNEEYLNRLPLDELSSKDYWSTPNDLKLYCNQFYSSFPTHSGWSGGIFWFDNSSDNLVSGTFNSRLNGTGTVPSSGGGWSWGNIRSVNYILENYGTVTGSEAEINHYVGEARFFRAYYYFSLVKQFGDVPWFDKTMQATSEELYKERDSRDFIIDKIIEDLDFAIDNMYGKESAESFRLNSEIAILFKSRVALYEGTWEKYHAGTEFGVEGSNGSKYLQLAEDAAKMLIDKNKYTIAKDGDASIAYRNLFIQTDLSSNSEVLLWRKYDVELGITHNVQRYLPRSGGNTGLSKSLVDSYLDIDGNTITDGTLFKGYGSLLDVVEDRDPRLAQTVTVTGDPIGTEQPNVADTFFEKPSLQETGESRSTTGFHIFKGSDPSYIQSFQGNVGTTAAIVFRYAEALLNYAEAKAELGTLTQADVDMTINKIRDRVEMSHMILGSLPANANKEFPGLSDVINEVRRERRVETALEGLRFNDLMRWRAHELIVGVSPKGMQYINSDLNGMYADGEITVGDNVRVDSDGFIEPYQSTMPAGYGFNPSRDYLKPLPTSELTLNSNLTQNPGW